jgi:hypothetical protein
VAKHKILFVSKDMGSGNVLVPVAKIMRHALEVVVVAEGLSVPHWKKEEFNLYFQGTADYRDEPFSLDPYATLKKVKPDVVVTGHSNPLHLDEKFGLAANEAGIPLVWIQDFWGGGVKNAAKPDLIFTLDHIGADILKRNPRFEKKDIRISGNLALNALENFAIPEDLAIKLNHLTKPVILLAGGGVSTASVIKVIVESLKQTPGDWTLVPRFHPKWAERAYSGGKTYGEIWRELLSELGDRVVEVPTQNADALAMLCDMTVSPFSTLLLSSVVAKKIPVSVRTPEMIKDISGQNGLTRYPLVEAGAVLEISSPVNLKVFADRALCEALTQKQVDYLTKAKPFDSFRVSQQILELAK